MLEGLLGKLLGGLLVWLWERSVCGFVNEGEPDVVYVKACVLWNCVVFVDLDGFSDTSGVPVFDGSDESCVIPIDAMFVLLCMFDNG